MDISEPSSLYEDPKKLCKEEGQRRHLSAKALKGNLDSGRNSSMFERRKRLWERCNETTYDGLYGFGHRFFRSDLRRRVLRTRQQRRGYPG